MVTELMPAYIALSRMLPFTFLHSIRRTWGQLMLGDCLKVLRLSVCRWAFPAPPGDYWIDRDRISNFIHLLPNPSPPPLRAAPELWVGKKDVRNRWEQAILADAASATTLSTYHKP